MTTREASCSCGELRVTTHGEPVRISVCHCHACQRRTGSVFGAQARFETGKLEIAGESSTYIRTGESGSRILLHFCPQCGSTVYYQLEDDQSVVAVPVGAFADQNFPAPEFSVYETSRHDWVHLPDNIEGSG